jgi:hypothetical protein
MQQKSKKLTLKERIENIPRSRYFSVLEEIEQECGKSRATVYRWINKPETMDKLHAKKVEEILVKYSI